MTTPSAAPPPQYAVPMRNGFGITALVLGIVGIVPFGLMPITGFIALVLGVLSLIFGLLGLQRTRKGIADNTKMSWAGTVLGAVATALGIVMTVVLFQATNQFVNDMDRITNQGQSAPQAPGQQRSGDSGGDAVVPAEPEAGPELDSGLGEGGGPEVVPPASPAPQQPPPQQEPLTQPATSEVTVKATGDMGTAEVYYTVGTKYATTSESLPFSVTENVPDDAVTMPASVMVSAPMPEDFMNPPQGTIGCQVIVDGVVVDENSANTDSAGFASVTCDQPG